jgi:hypothetical protein
MSIIGQKKKRVVKSYTINTETAKKLTIAASALHTSINSIINRLLTDFVEIEAPTSDLGLVVLSCYSFGALLKAISREKIYEHSYEAGKVALVSLPHLRNIQKNMEGFKGFLKVAGEYFGWGHYHESSRDGQITVVFQHPYGEVWTDFMAAFFAGAYEGLMGRPITGRGIISKTENLVVITMKAEDF